MLHCLENIDCGNIEHNAPESTNQPLICDDNTERFSSDAFIENDKNVMNNISPHATVSYSRSTLLFTYSNIPCVQST